MILGVWVKIMLMLMDVWFGRSRIKGKCNMGIWVVW